MLLSFGFVLPSVVLFFLRDIFTAKAASPPVDTEPATISPRVVKQNGHIFHLLGALGWLSFDAKPPLYW